MRSKHPRRSKASERSHGRQRPRRPGSHDESSDQGLPRSWPPRSTCCSTTPVSGPLRRFIPGVSGIRFSAGAGPQATACHPSQVHGLIAELAKVGVGRSDLAPHEKDRRFSEEAWAPATRCSRRTLQSYLAPRRAAGRLVDDADLPGSTTSGSASRDERRRGTGAQQQPGAQPVGEKTAIDTGGRSALSGTAAGPRPSSAAAGPVDGRARAFSVGKDLALTPGAVVLRTTSSS